MATATKKMNFRNSVYVRNAASRIDPQHPDARYWKVTGDRAGSFKGRTMEEKDMASVPNRRVTFDEYDKWNHSECQSSCIRRGGQRCVW